MSEVLFRLDAGRIWGVSYGHLYRCLAIRNELLTQYGQHCKFMMRDIKEGIELARSMNLDIHEIPSNIGSDEEIELIKDQPAKCVVFDVIDIDKKDLGSLTRHGKNIVVIDDTGNKRIDAQNIINGSILTKSHSYSENFMNSQYFLGTKFCVLSSDFTKTVNINPRVPPRSIMVSFGGSDPLNLTSRVIATFSSHELEIPVRIVLGPGHKNTSLIETQLNKTKMDVTLLKNVKNMASLMSKTDLSVTSGGRTAYEAAAMGIPNIIIPSNENEADVANQFSNLGAAYFIKPDLENFPMVLINRIRCLFLNRDKRILMSQTARNLIDLQGCNRVSKIIQEANLQSLVPS